MFARLVNTDNQLICTNSEYSQSGPFACEQASDFPWHSVLFIWALSLWGRCGKIQPGVSNVSNALLFGENYFGLLTHSSSDSSLWPRAGPGTNLAQISGVFQRAGTEDHRGFPLFKKKKKISVHNCPSKIGAGTLLYSIVELLH